MTEIKNIEVESQDQNVPGIEDEVIELGQASRKTRGLFLGVIPEISILPLRLF